MDRSFLSDAGVIAASRQFVCVRLTSYEDDAETAFCRSLMVGRSGDVENTTFTLLAPDGKTKLVRPSRSTKGLFADAADMAKELARLSAKYAGHNNSTPPLPIALDARIGLDIAACDNRPLVLVIASETSARSELEAKVAALAWSPEFIGRFVYASAASAAEIKGVPDLPSTDGCYIIEPDAFGQAGRVMQKVTGNVSGDRIAQAMQQSLRDFHATAKNRQAHRAAGTQAGAFWETKNPVTDPEEANARERTKKEIERRSKDKG